MVSFSIDASALAKRYVPETGSPLVDFLLDHVAEHRIYVPSGHPDITSACSASR
jgi:hypothetical protein